MDESREKFIEVAQSVFEVWNKLSKEFGWPHRKSSDDIMREGKAVRSIIRYWGSSNPPEETSKAIEWVLRRWNWNKAPAPLNLLASKTQWNGYQMIINRSQEEAETASEEKMLKLFEWAENEMHRNLIKGVSPKQSVQSIEELSKILGKTSSLKDKEKEIFSSFCHNLIKKLNYEK